jgi:hypothetical protein
MHFGEASVRPDEFIVRNCGEYAAAQFDILLGELKSRGAVFRQAREMVRA